MKTEVLERVRGARDFYALTRALLGLCEPFGPVHAFKLVHNRGAGRVVCFIEMESPKQQPPLVRALGAKVIDGSACLDIPVEDDFGVSDEAASVLPASLAIARPRPSAAPQASR
jgi:hypothetical protein